MKYRVLDYGYIVATIVLTVYGQFVLKWRIAVSGQLPEEFLNKLRFLVGLVFEPWIFSGFVAAFLAALAWMAAMTRFELSHAYPFMSLNFVLVLLLSGWLLHEPLNVAKVGGVLLIVVGTIVAGYG